MAVFYGSLAWSAASACMLWSVPWLAGGKRSAANASTPCPNSHVTEE